jgi:hypothetical protein
MEQAIVETLVHFFTCGSNRQSTIWRIHAANSTILKFTIHELLPAVCH